MKRAVPLALAASLFITGVAMAETQSGTASNGQPLTVSFTTDAAGTVTVNAQWQPKGNARYSLSVNHLADPNDPFSTDQACQVYDTQAGSVHYGLYGSGERGDWTCTIPDGLAGYWTAEFRPLSGKTDVTLTTP